MGDRVAEGGRRTQLSKRERKRLRRETEMRELKRSFEEKLMAGNVPMEELIMDMVESTARVAEIPLRHLSRSP